MPVHRLKTAIALATLVAQLHACTWVKTTPDGAKVRVVQASELRNCTSKGEVTATLKSRVGAFERKPGKVAGELEALARNEAATMGGDTIVARSLVNEGKQTFEVYRCQP
jgi:hypothetical protein